MECESLPCRSSKTEIRIILLLRFSVITSSHLLYHYFPLVFQRAFKFPEDISSFAYASCKKNTRYSSAMPISTFPLLRNLDLCLEKFCKSFSIKTKYGAVAATAVPVVVLAGAYIVWAYGRRSWKVKNEFQRVVFTRSMSVAALHGGKLAMQRLMDYHDARVDAEMLNAAESELKALLRAEKPDFKKLQSTVAKLEMSGTEDAAVGILERAVENARKEGKSHEAYEIEMLLVEVYIYKGDLKKAQECECLRHVEISDARRPLYKAIMYLMLEGEPKEEQASKCWEEFKDIQRQFYVSTNMEGTIHDHEVSSFSELDKVVKLLKQDILRVHGKTKR